MSSVRAHPGGRRWVWSTGILFVVLVATVQCAPDDMISPLDPTAALAETSSSKGWWWWRQTLTIDPDSATISEPDDTVRLFAILSSGWKRDAPPSVVEVDWFLLDPEVVAIEDSATSSPTVLLRGLEPGVARIIAIYDGLAAIASVSVGEGDPDDPVPVAAVVSDVQPVLLVGDTVTVRPNLIDEDSVVIATEPSEWSADFDSAFVSISEDFLVTALAPTPPGSSSVIVLTHTDTELAAEVAVTILPDGDPGVPVAAVASESQPVLLVGDTVTVRPNLIDEDSMVIPTEPSEWSREFDSAFVSVSEDFLVTALAPTPPGSTSVVSLTHTDTELATDVGVVILPDGDPGEDNEPPGLTVIGAFDGSVKESSGHAFGISSFGSWFSSNPANVVVVTDPSNPTGSGRSLRFTWRGSDYRGAGIATARTFVGGPYRELYIRLRVFMESGGWDFGHKFFYLGRHTDSRPSHNKPVQYSIDRPTGRNPEKIRLVGNGVPNGMGNGIMLDSGSPNYGGLGKWPLVLGQWLNIEHHFVAESSPGAADGAAQLWVNGQLVASRTGVAWNKPEHPTPGFNGMEWYATANTIVTTSHYRIGELYISGRR